MKDTATLLQVSGINYADSLASLVPGFCAGCARYGCKITEAQHSCADDDAAAPVPLYSSVLDDTAQNSTFYPVPSGRKYLPLNRVLSANMPVIKPQNVKPRSFVPKVLAPATHVDPCSPDPGSRVASIPFRVLVLRIALCPARCLPQFVH